MLDVSGVIPHTGSYADGDGFTATRKDGSECSMSCVLIYGEAGEPSTGLTWEETHCTPTTQPPSDAASAMGDRGVPDVRVTDWREVKARAAAPNGVTLQDLDDQGYGITTTATKEATDEA